MRPAERCCNVCSLAQGVQIISTYTVIIGVINFLGLFSESSDHATDARSDAGEVIDGVQTVVGTFALFAGLKGFVGVMLRDPGRLHVLFLYHGVYLAISCCAIVFKEQELCTILDGLKKQHSLGNHTSSMRNDGVRVMDCQSARTAVFIEFCIQFCVFSYFIFIIWSLMKRIEAGEWSFSMPRHSQHLIGGDREALFARSLDLSSQSSGFGSQQNLLSSSPVGPVAFTGQPRSLGEDMPLQAPNAMVPFSGNAYRLE